MKLSVVIPARDEEGSIEQTVAEIAATLRRERIPFEIVVVDDGSTDQTATRVQQSIEHHSGVRLVSNTGRHGFGMAVRAGLAQANGEALAGRWKKHTIARLVRDSFAAARLWIIRSTSWPSTGWPTGLSGCCSGCDTTTSPMRSNVTEGRPSMVCSR